eukprot:scaffold17649_cov21-Tisochrysis_lutea.AAC.5
MAPSPSIYNRIPHANLACLKFERSLRTFTYFERQWHQKQQPALQKRHQENGECTLSLACCTIKA